MKQPTSVDRRSFLKAMGLTAAGTTMSLAGCSKSGETAPSPFQPKGKVPEKAKARKIIFIMTDTQRWDMLGCVNPDMKTPFLDKMANSGLRFDYAYSVSPVCGPARSAIFTGTYPHTNGVWGNNQGLADNVQTIGPRLYDNGYHTAYVGKWHLDGTDYFGNGICPNGWDPQYWYDMRRYLEELSDEDKTRSRNPATNEESIDAEFTYAHRITDRSIDFLEKNGDKDFFLVASFDEPHHPFLCPEPFASQYKDYEWPKNPSHYDTLENKPPHQQMWGEGRQFENKDNMKITNPYFFGCNSFVDDEIGRLLEKIDQICPDALIVYTSDHGDFLGAHSLKGKGPAAYDDVARIPFLVRWKGHTPEKMVSKDPMSHINIVPTLLDAAGVDIPDFIQAKSILPTLENPKIKPNEEVFIEFGRFEVNHDGFGAFQPMRTVYDGKYKMSINLMSGDELYDMENDPHEVNNLIYSPEHHEVRAKLHGKILEWIGQTRDPFRGTYWESRPWNHDFKPSWEYTHITRSRKDDGYNPRVWDYNTGLPIQEYTRKKDLDKKK